jgi:rhodanese-related sulfurtransferase
VSDFAGLHAARGHRSVVVLDVRRDQEWRESRIRGAVHVPLHELPARLAEVAAGEVWVHCEAGYRASIAASFLDAAGRTVVAIDDEYDRAARAGLPVEGRLPQAARGLPGSADHPVCGLPGLRVTGSAPRTWPRARGGLRRAAVPRPR